MSGVAVVIPNLNGGKSIKQAIESVLAQTCKPTLLIVDGGSKDDTESVLSQFSMLAVVHEYLPGRGRARNTGIQLLSQSSSPPEFILPLDSDDWIEPTFIERCLALFGNPGVGVVGTALKYEERGVWVPPLGVQYPDEPVTLERLLTANRIFSCSMFRLACWREVGGYDVVHPTHEDWDFWIRIVAAGWRVVCVREPLFHYRVHPESATAQAGAAGDRAMKAYIWQKHAALFALCGFLRKRPHVFKPHWRFDE